MSPQNMGIFLNMFRMSDFIREWKNSWFWQPDYLLMKKTMGNSRLLWYESYAMCLVTYCEIILWYFNVFKDDCIRGVCSFFPEFLHNFTECQILWSLYSVFHAFTLKLPIQTSLSVVPTYSSFLTHHQISAKQSHPCNLWEFPIILIQRIRCKV